MRTSRPWRFTPHTVDHHTGAKYAAEGRCFTAYLIPEVMAERDEVWLTGAAKPGSRGQAQYEYYR